MSAIDALNWRYATKKMKNDDKVDEEKVNKILEAARLAPSGMGLQPYKIIVVTNHDLKEKIKKIAFNQSQIADCSHLLIFAAWDLYTEERIRNVYHRINSQRGLPKNHGEDNLNFIISSFANKTADEQSNHAAKQAYISFGIAITQAALLNVDATPMEGFDAKKLDVLLKLDQLGLKSTTLLPLGYRNETEDWLVGLKKVRTAADNFVMELK